MIPQSRATGQSRAWLPHVHAVLREVGWKTGFEPATPGITIRCSNQLSYIHHGNIAESSGFRTAKRRLEHPGTGQRQVCRIPPGRPGGAPGRNRTCNHRLRRPVLYPVELRAPDRIVASAAAPCCAQPDGRGRGIRTPDILLPKQARYQTALYPAGFRFQSAPGRPRKAGYCRERPRWCQTRCVLQAASRPPGSARTRRRQ